MKKSIGIAILIALLAIGTGCKKDDDNNTNSGNVISGQFSGNQSGTFIVTDDIEVPAGQTLTLAPGTVLMFQDSVKMLVRGRLIAEADSVHMIRFTSAKPVPSSGDWGGIIFYPNSSANYSSMKFCFIGYGNRFNNAYEQDTSAIYNKTPGAVFKGMVSIYGATVKLERCQLFKAGWEGIEVQGGGSAEVNFCNLFKTSNCGMSIRIGGTIDVNNTNVISSLDVGLVVHDTVDIHGNQISCGSYTGGYNNIWSNRSGDYKRKPTGILTPLANDISEDPQFINPDNFNFNLKPSSPIIDMGNPSSKWDQDTPSDSSRPDIGVFFFQKSPTKLFGPLNRHLTKNVYRVIADCWVPADSTLIIDPGCVIKFDSLYGIHVQGTLTAIGTASDSIVFTSNRDNPAAGDWKNIYFDGLTSHRSQMQYAKVKFASWYLPAQTAGAGAIALNGVSVKLNDITIQDCFNNGLDLINGCGDTISNVTIERFGLYGISCNLNINTVFRHVKIRNGLGTGINIVSNSNPNLNNVLIADNGGSGIVMSQLSAPIMTNLTIANNHYDGITVRTNSSPRMTNSIVALNYRYGINLRESSQLNSDTSNFFWYQGSVDRSFWRDDSSGRANLFVILQSGRTEYVAIDPTRVVNPMFDETSGDKYRLMSGSPAAGHGAFAGWDK